MRHACVFWPVIASSSRLTDRHGLVPRRAQPRAQAMTWSDVETKVGHLSAFETCKAFAFHAALEAIAKHLKRPAYELWGTRSHAWIAEHLRLKGGGCPSERAVQAAVARCKDESWRPGQPEAKAGGRPPIFSAKQKKAMAAAAMGLKRKLVRPTPARVRAQVPRLSLNAETGEAASNWTIYNIFKTRCYDDAEDDPWQYLPTVTKDYLPESMKPKRVAMAQHILETMPAAACANHVAIDPCSSLLPKDRTRFEEQAVAALGTKRFMSPGCKFDGVNLRASKFATSQAGRSVLQLHWTPIFARGVVRIYICDPAAAERDPRMPAQLNRTEELSKFIKHVLPHELRVMEAAHGWPTLPRTVVHDKASHMVNSKAQKVNAAFHAALGEAGLHSWAGEGAQWMAARFSDAYIHETLISHMRRALDHKFPRAQPGETYTQFRRRMDKVEAHLNSENFAARENGGLHALGKDLRDRCRAMIARQGERLSK